MMEPEKNVKFKIFGSLFLDDKISFQNVVLFFFCFSFVLMTKQLLKHDFGFPLKADLSVLIMSLILMSRQYRCNF